MTGTPSLIVTAMVIWYSFQHVFPRKGTCLVSFCRPLKKSDDDSSGTRFPQGDVILNPDDSFLFNYFLQIFNNEISDDDSSGAHFP